MLSRTLLPNGVTALSLRGAAAVLLVMAASGCSTSSPRPLAPPITLDQLDVTHYGAAPCGLLRPDRAVRRHLVPPGAVIDNAGGPACRWNPDLPAYPAITAAANTAEGLEQLYQRRGRFPFFEPTEIANYPAVHTTSDPAGPRAGHCTVHVGVADTATLDVTADYNAGSRGAFAAQPCSDADTLATEIMGQLLAGSP